MIRRYCKCENCGAEVEFDASIVLDTFPQQYGYECQKCKHKGFVLFDKTYSFPKGDYKIKLEETKMYTHCIICDAQFEVFDINSPRICKECKEAIKWAKRKMKDEQI